MNKSTKNIVSNVCVVAAIVVALGYVVSRFVHFGSVEFTDNKTIFRTPGRTAQKEYRRSAAENESRLHFVFNSNRLM